MAKETFHYRTTPAKWAAAQARGYLLESPSRLGGGSTFLTRGVGEQKWFGVEVGNAEWLAVHPTPGTCDLLEEGEGPAEFLAIHRAPLTNTGGAPRTLDDRVTRLEADYEAGEPVVTPRFCSRMGPTPFYNTYAHTLASVLLQVLYEPTGADKESLYGLTAYSQIPLEDVTVLEEPE
jgi:hypothetical protein